MITREEQIQREYYKATVDHYDGMHLHENDDHFTALRYVSALLNALQISSVLDVGCGTGRGIHFLQREHPELDVYGIDPGFSLLNAARKKGIDSGRIVSGSGNELPFVDKSFDAVAEFGILHHVKHPERVVSEMLRVAKKAVFISDNNIFGQGSLAGRILKLLLHGVGAWRAVKYIQTGGKEYSVSEGDGLYYSYSVYFQYGMLSKWSDRIMSIPVSQHDRKYTLRSPLIAAQTVLLCGLRDG